MLSCDGSGILSHRADQLRRGHARVLDLIWDGNPRRERTCECPGAYRFDDDSATYAGPQLQIPGLDQVNVPLPLSLHGSGLVNVVVLVGGVPSNAVQIQIQ